MAASTKERFSWFNKVPEIKSKRKKYIYLNMSTPAANWNQSIFTRMMLPVKVVIQPLITMTLVKLCSTQSYPGGIGDNQKVNETQNVTLF